jgi:hypothetical protein
MKPFAIHPSLFVRMRVAIGAAALIAVAGLTWGAAALMAHPAAWPGTCLVPHSDTESASFDGTQPSFN